MRSQRRRSFLNRLVHARVKEEDMARNSLERFVEGVRLTWGPLTSDVVANCRFHVEELLKTPAAETWLAALHREPPEDKELYRDPDHGFLLLAHAETAGRYRPPHDHGRGWVIYAVQKGEMEMATYVRMQDPSGTVRLVKRQASPVGPGQTLVFLPGDIHDTRCTADQVLYYRFTDRDLRKEDKEERMVTRYVAQDGVWTLAAARQDLN
jgi:hypothetical protein